jgi:signal transduction histidine kinase
MRDRVDSLGGRLVWRAAPGGGTQVAGRFPGDVAAAVG